MQTNTPSTPSTTEQEQNAEKKRKRVSKACAPCQRSHISCDSARPCKRCVEKGTTDKCVDVLPKRRGRKTVEDSSDINFAIATPYNNNFQLQETKSTPANAYDISLSSYNMAATEMWSSRTQNYPYSATSQIPAFQSINASSFGLPQPKLMDISIPLLSNSTKYTMSSSLQTNLNTLPPLVLESDSFKQSSPHSWQSSGTKHPTQDLFDLPQNPKDSKQVEEQILQKDELKLLSRDDVWTNEITDPRDTPSTVTSGDYMRKLIELLNSRQVTIDSGSHDSLPSDPFIDNIFISILTKNIALLWNITQSLSLDVFPVIRQDFENQLKMLMSFGDNCATPIVLFERNGRIHYVNKAYQELTNFSYPLPSDRVKFMFLKIMDRSGVKQYFRCFSSRIAHGDTFSYRSGILDERDSKVDLTRTDHLYPEPLEARYIQGLISVTCKRDMLGLPLIMMAIFIPFPSND